MSINTLAHPTLRCKLRGKVSNTVIQYRNLKFANISGRWKDAVPDNVLHTDSENVFDATKFGPSCPHKRGAQAWDLTLLGDVKLPLQEGHRSEEEEMDEFECLHVNVTVPNQIDGNRKALPVFVWVHGGGLSIGSNSWPQYDLQRFVECSVEISKPVIGVALNYRVGILGFLASQELGIDGNFGYKDQVLAFRWVKKHIAGFGGDPENVTAAGESAGGISLSTLLCADVGGVGLFERVVVMSGEATLRKSRDRRWQEMMYLDQLKFHGMDEMDVEERARKLREMDAEELANKLPLAQHFCATVDGKFLKKDASVRLLSDGAQEEGKPKWCKEFVIGDTAHDGTVVKGRILDNLNSFTLLQTLCAEFLTPSETSSLLSAYSLPASSPEKQYSNLLELASDLRFYLPTLAVHTGWKSSAASPYARRYHVHATNPFEGPFKGLASHELDVAYLLGTVNGVMDEQRRGVGRQMAERWIRFANGEGWCEEGRIVVISDEGVSDVEEEVYDREFRRGRGIVLVAIGAERLWKVADAWQGVRREDQNSRDQNPHL